MLSGVTERKEEQKRIKGVTRSVSERIGGGVLRSPPEIPPPPRPEICLASLARSSLVVYVDDNKFIIILISVSGSGGWQGQFERPDWTGQAQLDDIWCLSLQQIESNGAFFSVIHCNVTHNYVCDRFREQWSCASDEDSFTHNN